MYASQCTIYCMQVNTRNTTIKIKNWGWGGGKKWEDERGRRLIGRKLSLLYVSTYQILQDSLVPVMFMLPLMGAHLKAFQQLTTIRRNCLEKKKVRYQAHRHTSYTTVAVYG